MLEALRDIGPIPPAGLLRKLQTVEVGLPLPRPLLSLAVWSLLDDGRLRLTADKRLEISTADV